MSKRCGLSYIEVMISLTILTIVVAPVMNMIYRSSENIEYYIRKYDGTLKSRNMSIEISNDIKEKEDNNREIEGIGELIDVERYREEYYEEGKYDYVINIVINDREYEYVTSDGLVYSVENEIKYSKDIEVKEREYVIEIEVESDEQYKIEEDRENLLILLRGEGIKGSKLTIKNGDNISIVRAVDGVDIINKEGVTYLVGGKKREYDVVTVLVLDNRGKEIGNIIR